MKFLDFFNSILFGTFNEERNGGNIYGFHVEVGENEGDNIPHFHLNNGEVWKKQKLAAIRLDMPYYFVHGNKKDYKEKDE